MAIILPEIQVYVCVWGGGAPFGFLTPGLGWLTSVLQASVRNIKAGAVISPLNTRLSFKFLLLFYYLFRVCE